jgi:hypothetical protein
LTAIPGIDELDISMSAGATFGVVILAIAIIGVASTIA